MIFRPSPVSTRKGTRSIGMAQGLYRQPQLAQSADELVQRPITPSSELRKSLVQLNEKAGCTNEGVRQECLSVLIKSPSFPEAFAQLDGVTREDPCVSPCVKVGRRPTTNSSTPPPVLPATAPVL
jgi:hypothetical protein